MPADEIEYRDVPPDPSIAEAVGRHHSLATAIADLVDNSIDANAGRVHVRFCSELETVRSLRIIDDGDGMDSATIDAAMAYARKRDYEAGDLGHFGIGLKAASLSQADVLDVYSRRVGGPPVGRRIRANRPTRVAELDSQTAAGAFVGPRAALPGGPASSGTIVHWSEPRSFLSSVVEDDQRQWFDDTVEQLRMHLGLVFHRLIADGRVVVTVDQFDVAYDAAGSPRTVDAIDPFDYVSPSTSDLYSLRCELDGSETTLQGHVWPHSQASSPAYRLFGRSGESRQGFYVYRHARLLQAGGWNGVIPPSRDYALARVRMELDDVLHRHVTINPEKADVEFDADLSEAIQRSIDDRGRGFRDYLAAAERAASISRQRNRLPITLVQPRRGLSPDLLDVVGETVEFSEHDPFDIRWRSLPDGSLIDVDLERRTLWLNHRYRWLLGAETGEADDAPLIKTLLLLLYSRFFAGSKLGARETRELRAWDVLVTAALEEELEREEARKGRRGD